MSYYNDYQLTGLLFEDRQTVARALDDPNLSYSQKQEIVNAHNWKNVDSMSTDTYTNRIVFGVSNDPVLRYDTVYPTSTYQPEPVKPTPKTYNVSFADGHLYFDDKEA